MAGFTSQSTLSSKWSDFVEAGNNSVGDGNINNTSNGGIRSISPPIQPESSQVKQGIRNVVGWLKQASIEVREAGKKAVSQLQNSDPNFIISNDYEQHNLTNDEQQQSFNLNEITLNNLKLLDDNTKSLSSPSSPLHKTNSNNNYKTVSYNINTLNRYSPDYYRTSPITQLEKNKIFIKNFSNMKSLTILHYNDVYNIESNSTKEPIGGAARFCTAIKSFKDLDPLVLFSGDIFSPSMLSTYTNGEQMIPVLNSVDTKCAVFGNHDFDHGLDVLTELIKKTNFPWLMSNVVDNETGRPLGGGKISHFLYHNHTSIGVIGLVEREWLETLPTIDPNEVTYIDYVKAGNQLAEELRNEGCEIVIALTHMRTPNDINLAKNCPDIDIILGGHDHVYEIKEVNDIFIIKSGTDFRQFSKISIDKNRNEKGKIKVEIECIDVTSKYDEDENLSKELLKYTEMIESKMTEVLGNFSVELDGRFSEIRTNETNLGDWVCDVILAATGADVVIINSGTFRSDQIHPPGPFTMKDLSNMIPMRDPLIVLEITGKTLFKALENSVSGYPKLEGRFPQVAGISFAFDPSKSSGERVDPKLIQIGDEWLNLDQSYKICIKSYMYGGCDGYTMFKDSKIIMDDDSCPEIGLAIQNHFKAIDVRMGKGKHSKHRQSLVTLSRRHSMVQMLDSMELDGPSPIRKLSLSMNTRMTDPHSFNSGTKQMLRRASLDDLEQTSCQLAPKIQHRIIKIQNEEHHKQLLLKRETLIANAVIAEVEDE